jgi:hypothetical protein
MPRFSRFVIAALLAGSLGWPAVAPAQCLLANPSFELSGAGTTFGGWNQFGPTGSSTEASHGHRSARVSGPNSGAWAVAGYWQPLGTAPGERWIASVRAWNRSSNPLAGGSQAILNIEWRDGGSNLISYESYTVADASSPADQWIDFSVESGAAPAGAVQARLVLGVLQGPTDPQPIVLFDEATFDNAGPPTLDDIQWNDFPGGRTILFSGRPWRVKGPGYYGPGPNLFCNSTDCVWVDANERLHLTLQSIGGQWYSTEVAAEQALGYGDYVFTTVGRLDQLDPRVVFGLFLWQYGPCYDSAFLWWNPYNEIDVEFSRWGNPAGDIAQFVAQPFDYPGNIERFDATFSNDELTSHAFRWLYDRVEFRSWRGGPQDETPGNMIHAWTYTGPHIPRPEQPRVHINLWRFGDPPGSAQEVVLDAFTFVPADVVDVPWSSGDSGERGLLAPAQPNPFSRSTLIRYTLSREARTELAIYDITGRRIRTLVSGIQSAGPHQATWDGFDDAGRRPQPGIYLYRLLTGTDVETGRVVLLR